MLELPSSNGRHSALEQHLARQLKGLAIGASVLVALDGDGVIELMR